MRASYNAFLIWNAVRTELSWTQSKSFFRRRIRRFKTYAVRGESGHIIEGDTCKEKGVASIKPNAYFYVNTKGGNTMSDKDIELLIKLANAKLDRGVSEQEALNSFVNAGILNNEGAYTEPYKDLEAITL